MMRYDAIFPKYLSLPTEDYAAQQGHAKNTQINGVIKAQATDFCVDEVNTTPLSGSGEHLWLLIEKTGENTEWVARQLAQLAQVPIRNVGFAGLKDRHAKTSQWFSVQLPRNGFQDDVANQLPDALTVMKTQWHNKKLKRGNLAGNEFSIVIRNLTGNLEQKDIFRSLQEKVNIIAEQGVPNYFGVQRFGHEMGNIGAAEAWFQNLKRVKKRHLKSLLLSSARSWIFNHILARRVEDGSWNLGKEGDLYQLDGTHSWFDDPFDTQIQQRLTSGDIHPTGALWGNQEPQSKACVARLEQEVADCFQVLANGVSQRIAQQDRRALRVIPKKISTYKVDENALQLRFFLPAGAFATSVVREIVEITTP